MADSGGPWTFTDDRGRLASADHPPRRVVGYLRAAAALHDWGLRPVGAFGSQHDGGGPDPAKAGRLDLAALTYLGGGADLDESALRDLSPDLVVSVTYDDATLYGMPGPVADRIEERCPTLALGVGAGRTLPAMLDRFAELAAALGADLRAPAAADGAADFATAQEAVRAAAGARPGARVLALSGGDQDRVHLARPAAWPELRHLGELGVALVDPAPGPGSSWSTVPWQQAAALEPDVVLYDVRASALPVASARALPYARSLTAEPARTVVPWNPEAPCSPGQYAALLRAVAAAVGAEAVGGEAVGGEAVGGEAVGGEAVGGEAVGGEGVGPG